MSAPPQRACRDGPVRAGRRRSATRASPTPICSQQVPPAGAGGERCLPRCPRGPRQMGWPGQMGTDEARVTWAAGGVQLPEGPRVTVSLIRPGNPTCSSCSVVYSLLSLSLSLSCSPPPTDEVSHLQGSAACRTPGGSRAMPSPKLGTLHARSPGPQVFFACT